MADDLFRFIDCLWTKETPGGNPPVFMIHRFLASDRDLAEATRVIQREVREPAIAFRTWQGLLPRARSAPRFSYVAAKRPPAEEALVARVMAVERLRRGAAEEAVELVRQVGKLEDLYNYYGVEVKQ